MKLVKVVPVRIVLAGCLATSIMALPLLLAQAPAAQTPAAEGGRGGRGGRGGGQGGAQAAGDAQGGQAAAPGAAGGGRGGGRGGVGTTPAPTSPVTGNAVRGKQLYFDYGCYGCHGFNGETGRAFVGNWGNLQTEAGFVAFLRLRADRASMTPQTAMPNFPANTLSDAQAKDIYAHIRTFKSNSPEVKDIPTLNSIVNAASRPYKP